MSLTTSDILNHYKRRDVQEEILALAESREVSIRYATGNYGKRPDIIQYPDEILALAKQGASSFHASEERWHDPLSLKPGLTAKELDSNRKGWDLILDIDCPYFELSKICATVLSNTLESYDVPFSVKFSGSSGFHLGVAFETFPETINSKPIEHMFPDAARKIAAYLTHSIKNPLATAFLKQYTIEDISKITNRLQEELLENNQLNPFTLLKIDTVLISSRHLFRMPYSLNEKSGLISLPLKPSDIPSFEKDQAHPDRFTIAPFRFLENKQGTTRSLFIAAMDHATSIKTLEDQQRQSKQSERPHIQSTEFIPETLFPPCMHHLMKGIEDGKKRALFAAVNFLKHMSWPQKQIEDYLLAWNRNNPKPLRDADILNHISYHMKKELILPPNCDNMDYYKGIGICHPDNLCRKITNPVAYSLRKHHAIKMNEKPVKEPKPKKEPKPQKEKKPKKTKLSESVEATEIIETKETIESQPSTQSDPNQQPTNL